MSVPGLDETNAFVAVLEHKSFNKAAKQLGLSAPRMSELIRKLEERLGVRLVERTTRSVAATAAGERLLERLRPALDDYKAALESLNDFRSKPAGTLRLSVAPPAADFALGPVIQRFLSRYPEINLDIDIDSGLTDIVAGRFDAGIRLGERLSPGMVALRISDEMPRVVVASPAYLARRDAPKTPQDLARHDCILVRLPGGQTIPWRFRVKRRVVDVRVGGRMIVNQIGFALNAAIDGVGLLQPLLPYAAPDLSAGRLVTVLDDWAPPPLGAFFLYYPSRRQTRAALSALVGFLRDERRAASSWTAPARPIGVAKPFSV
jgi:DNA-binding transcriptional LysR family regulator